MVELSVIIVNFNTRKILKNCLTSLLAQTKNLDFEVLVVDNGSTDNSLKMLKTDFPQVKLIANKQNLGFAKANNQALRYAQGKLLLLLNSDTIVLDKAITKMVEFMRGNLKVGILGAKLLNPDGRPQPSTGKFLNLGQTLLWLVGGERLGLGRSSPLKTTKTDWISGACFLMRRQVLDKVGLLDDNFFMYLEEMEFCYRAHSLGFKVYFYPEAEVTHYIQASGSKSEAIWGIYKGLIYFYQKHKPAWQLAILRIMLKTKALLAWGLGVLLNNNYLKITYAQASSLV